MELGAVGKSVARVDAFDKVTGGRGYVVNMRLPGMLHAKILRSPIPHGTIRGIDVTRVERIQGVRAIVTHKDVPTKPFSPTGEFPKVAAWEDFTVKDTLILNQRVRYVGEPVAAVAATNEEIAEEALDLVEVDYEELRPVFNPAKTMEADSPKIHDVEHNIVSRIRLGAGDVERGFKEAYRIYENTYRTPRVQAVPLEPHVCVCAPSPDGRLTVWSSTQSIFMLRSRLAEALNMPKKDIRVERPPYIGGGFGTKVEMHAEAICALLALKAHAPVRLEFSRHEDFLATSRHPTTITLRSGVSKHGIFTARQARAIIDCGAYARHTHINPIMGTTFLSAYKCPNTLYEGYCVYTNNPPSGSFRGFGGPQPNFAVESQIDEMAEDLDMDPLEFRLRNMFHEGDPNLWTADGSPIGSYGLETCIKRGAHSIQWSARSKPGVAAGPVKHGIGAACLPSWVSGTFGIPYIPEFSGARVKIGRDGRVELLTACVDIGGGQSTVLAQIAAEELGVPMEEVQVVDSSTDTAPGDTLTHASRVSYVVGNAVRVAASMAREQLLREASKVLAVGQDELTVSKGKVVLKSDPNRGLELREIAQLARDDIVGEVHRLAPPSNAVPCAAHFVELEVDTMTGLVKVHRVAAAHDVGRAIYPLGVEGQIEGGVQLDLEYALTAEMVIDDETGKPLNTDLLDYKVVTAKDMPQVEAIIVETFEPTGPFGAKGVGEPPLIPVAAAVANAVYNATGVRIRDLPITPEKILRAINRII